MKKNRGKRRVGRRERENEKKKLKASPGKQAENQRGKARWGPSTAGRQASARYPQRSPSFLVIAFYLPGVPNCPAGERWSSILLPKDAIDKSHEF